MALRLTIGAALCTVAIMIAADVSVLAQGVPAKAAKSKSKTAKTSAVSVDGAVKLLNAGKTDAAVQALTSAIATGKLSSSDMARAIYYRGVALRKQGKSAQAIADFNNALFLRNGLKPELRKSAEEQRSAAYREIGGTVPAGAGTPAANATSVKQAAAAKRPAAPAAPAAPVQQGWQTTTAARASRPSASQASPPVAAPAPVKSGGFFSSLFGGGTSKPKAPAVPRKSAPLPAAAASDGGSLTQVSSWSNTTAVKPAQSSRPPRRSTGGKQAAVETAAPAAGARKPTGRYRLVLSPVRSQDAANASATKVRAQFAGDLGSRQAVVEPTVLGSMGTFYRVRIGPFADAKSPSSICTKMRTAGLDCMLVKQ